MAFSFLRRVTAPSRLYHTVHRRRLLWSDGTRSLPSLGNSGVVTCSHRPITWLQHPLPPTEQMNRLYVSGPPTSRAIEDRNPCWPTEVHTHAGMAARASFLVLSVHFFLPFVSKLFPAKSKYSEMGHLSVLLWGWFRIHRPLTVVSAVTHSRSHLFINWPILTPSPPRPTATRTLPVQMTGCCLRLLLAGLHWLSLHNDAVLYFFRIS